MTEAGTLPARVPWPPATVRTRPTAARSRLAMRLWTLLHAQALLRGTIGGAGSAMNAEDDRWRLAAHRETAHRR